MTPQTDLRDEMDADDALLRAARHAHAASLDRLSPRVQAQLAQRRRAAMQPTRNAGRGWAMIATASTAVLAVAIGVFVMREGVLHNDSTQAPQVADNGAAMTAPVAPAAQPAPVDIRVADATTTTPSTIAPPDAAVAPQPVATDTLPDTLSDSLIAAEFDAVEAIEGATDDIGYGAFDETPDFYAWLGSEDALADVPESL
ncbi:hypothetical protein [Lysobacter brunescens]|uniref:Transmembrane protein n=1 Tax=Lysobacter brunescens TaxID=262323 RepID=A0ABW2YCM6_9GAMM